jgi:branched-chain amino acid transport system permease protein
LEALIQVLMGGVLLGGLYAMVAFGLSLIYGVVRILNFAHGTLLAVAGVCASLMYAQWHWHPLVLMSVLIPGFALFGWLFYIALLQPLTKRTHFESTVGTVLVTVGALLVLSDVTAKLAGSTQRNIPLRFEAIEIGQIVISMTQIWILGGIAIMTIAMHFFLRKTWFGNAIRAVTQEPVGAQICGVHSNRVKAATFAFGSAIVAIAAVLYTLSFPVDPYMGFSLTVKAFTIIILGGIGNLVGALLAGLFLGIAEGLTGFFWKPEWSPAISVILLLLILVVFPNGFKLRRRY